MPSLYELHMAKWANGCGSFICPPRAKHICFGRGAIPAEVAFIGEAPGESENVLGRPFVGPAGKLLDRIVEWARHGLPPFRCLFTNLVGCIPYEEPGEKKKAEAPSVESVMNCVPRLEELLEICQPKLVVMVGALARDWCKPGFKQSVKLPASAQHTIDITHPAALLRQPIAVRDFAIREQAVRLRNALQDVFHKGA